VLSRSPSLLCEFNISLMGSLSVEGGIHARQQLRPDD
jgi:hypothetical protein